MSKTIGANSKDWELNIIVKVMWFDEIIKMKVIGHSLKTNQVQVQHLDAQGSFYVTTTELLKLNKRRK